MRVLIDGRVIQDRYDGIGRQAFELVRGLASLEDSGPPLDLVVLRGSGADDRLSVDDLGGLRGVTIVDFEPAVASATEQLRWPSLLERLHPDVVFAPYHLAAPLLSSVPVVAVIHDCIFESDRRFAPGPLMRAAYTAATWAVVHRVTDVVTVSHATRDAVQRRYRVRIATTNVVPNGVDLTNSFERGPGLVAAARAALDLPYRYVLHVGVRRPHKNQETLVRAFARLAQTESDLHLVLVGKSDERFPDPVPDLVRRLRLDQRVQTIASVPEDLLPGVFAGAEVFAFPSFVEGFGMPVLEAMAVGTPVVAARTPAVAEVAGDAAVLVPSADAGGFAEAISRAIHDRGSRAALIEQGRGRVDRFRWADSAAGLARVLRRAAGRRMSASPAPTPASDAPLGTAPAELSGTRRPEPRSS